MKIKKYTAGTEQAAIEMVKDELGLDALILNIKKIQPRGLMSLFRKATVEVTAAYEEKKNSFSAELQEQETKIKSEPASDNGDKQKLAAQQVKINLLQQELDDKEVLLEKAASLLSASAHIERSKSRKYENNMLQIFYDTLLEQGVTSEIAEHLLSDVELLDERELEDISIIVKVVYNNIIQMLGEPSVVQIRPEMDTIVFLGPTGVGKTTTIAKLSSKFALNDNIKLGLITADTYRIAAVEQLKTYAEILGIDVGVVYNAEDLKEILPKMKRFNDLILVDTAGRSHKNDDAVRELAELISVVPEAEKFLVLSLTTKYEDLLDIVNAYAGITDFKLIFTKADETLFLGAILNICYYTNKRISYISNGQNVPDDIKIIKPDHIAKALLGLGGVI